MIDLTKEQAQRIIDEYENGSPLKDYLDRDEIDELVIMALEMIVSGG